MRALCLFTLVAGFIAGVTVQAVTLENAPENLSSEYLHQAGHRKVEFTLGVGREEGKSAWTNQDPNGISYQTISETGKPQKVNITRFPISVTAEYGFTPTLAAGVDLIYGNGKYTTANCPTNTTCKDSTSSGLYNPALYLKGMTPVGSAAFAYGLIADIGVEKYEVDAAGNTNLATGGTTLTPYLGYVFGSGFTRGGARFQYDVYKGDRKATYATTDTEPARDSTTSRGNTWALDAFFESKLESFMLGGNVAYLHTSESSFFSNGKSGKSGDASHTWIFQVYAPVYSDGFMVLPNIAYEMQTFTDSSYFVSNVNSVQFGVAVRF